MTDEELEPIYRYISRKFREQQLDARNPTVVIKWMLENPLPSPEEVVEEIKQQEEAEKQRRIAVLREELERLEGE
ncbi:MAG: hypothetical protein NWE76_01870 [Candidatus Bathyarchaeota archaeon]|nr:hypothetical protein [Candidatus Bathyarchaeota archaeon]